MSLKILIRKVKAKLTGKVPCSYRTLHGHDFERTSEIKEYRGIKYAFFECTVCGLRAEYNQLQGYYTEI